jgi:hypothetical protein
MLNFLEQLRKLSEEERRSLAGVSAFFITVLILLPVVFFRGIHLPKTSPDKAIPIEVKNTEEITDEFSKKINEIKQTYGMITTAMTQPPSSSSMETGTSTATTTAFEATNTTPIETTTAIKKATTTSVQ